MYIFAKPYGNKRKGKAMVNSNRKELKKNLRAELRKYYGAINEIAQRHGCSREWVRVVLRDEYQDDKLLLICAEVLKEKKSARARVDELVVLALTA